MGIKTCLAALCLAVLAATVVDVPPVEAQTYTAQPDRPVNRPRARITVEPDIAERARLAIERMVSIGGGATQPLSPVPNGVDPGE